MEGRRFRQLLIPELPITIGRGSNDFNRSFGVQVNSRSGHGIGLLYSFSFAAFVPFVDFVVQRSNVK